MLGGMGRANLHRHNHNVLSSRKSSSGINLYCSAICCAVTHYLPSVLASNDGADLGFKHLSLAFHEYPMHSSSPFNSVNVFPYLAPTSGAKQQHTTGDYARWAVHSAKRLACVLNTPGPGYVRQELVGRESLALVSALALFAGRTLKAALGVAALTGACVALAYQYFKRQPQ
jgi:hypothetical protein